jgi:hypothetical protein
MSDAFLKDSTAPRTQYQDTPSIPNLPQSAVVDGTRGALQQSYRFILMIEGFDAAYITNVSRPSYNINTRAFKLLNWTFNYPMELKWNTINFTLREIFDRDLFNTSVGVFMDKLGHLSWANPNEVSMFQPKDLDKRNLINGLGPVRIKMLDPDGVIYEEWELINAMVTDMKPTDMNYSSDDLSGIAITLTYDYARLHRHMAKKPNNYAAMVTDSPAQVENQRSQLSFFGGQRTKTMGDIT